MRQVSLVALGGWLTRTEGFELAGAMLSEAIRLELVQGGPVQPGTPALMPLAETLVALYSAGAASEALDLVHEVLDAVDERPSLRGVGLARGALVATGSAGQEDAACAALALVLRGAPDLPLLQQEALQAAQELPSCEDRSDQPDDTLWRAALAPLRAATPPDPAMELCARRCEAAARAGLLAEGSEVASCIAEIQPCEPLPAVP